MRLIWIVIGFLICINIFAEEFRIDGIRFFLPGSVLPYLKDGYFLPLRSGKVKCPHVVRTVWFFGQAAEYAPDYPDAEKTFVSPPEFFELPEGAKKIE